MKFDNYYRSVDRNVHNNEFYYNLSVLASLAPSYDKLELFRRCHNVNVALYFGLENGSYL